MIYKRSVSDSCRWPDTQLMGNLRLVYEGCVFLLCAVELKEGGVDPRLCSHCFLAAAKRGFCFSHQMKPPLPWLLFSQSLPIVQS